MYLVYFSFIQFIHSIIGQRGQRGDAYMKPLFRRQEVLKSNYIRQSLVLLILSIILYAIPFIIILKRKQKSRILLFFLVPGFSEIYFIISLLHLNKIIANGVYDMSDSVWNKSFYFN